MTKELLYLESYPIIQNRVFDNYEESVDCSVGNIRLVQDFETGLIYNDAFNPETIDYDANYNNEQSNSLKFQSHLLEVANLVEMYLGKSKLIEVGCGKGFFFELLLSKGFDIHGFDPTYTGNNNRIIKRYFEPNLVQDSNGLILRHVLEHIQNPVEFLFKLKEANGGKGLIYIEVPCLEWILENKVWYDIFYEHVNYFRLSDFYNIFGSVVSAGNFFGGQYLYVVADLSSLRIPIKSDSQNLIFPSDFFNSLNTIKKNSISIWGASSKGVIFSILAQRKGILVNYAIDINQEKQGKYLPLTGTKVISYIDSLSLIHEGSEVVVMNSNYLDEINNLSKNRFNLKSIDLE